MPLLKHSEICAFWREKLNFKQFLCQLFIKMELAQFKKTAMKKKKLANSRKKKKKFKD